MIIRWFFLLLLCFSFYFFIGIAEKDSVLTLFISILSGPKNKDLRDTARTTWLLSCIKSPHCDYRFFIDTNNVTLDLLDESRHHHDLVFRGFCDLMLRHPNNIHYGNSPVESHPDFGYVTAERPDYYYRRM